MNGNDIILSGNADLPDDSVTLEKLAPDARGVIDAKADDAIDIPYPYPPYYKPDVPYGETQIPTFLEQVSLCVAWTQNCFNAYGQALSAEEAQHAYNADNANYAYTASYSYDSGNANYANDSGRANEADHAMSAASLDSSGYDWYCLDKMRTYMAENFGLTF